MKENIIDLDINDASSDLEIYELIKSKINSMDTMTQEHKDLSIISHYNCALIKRYIINYMDDSPDICNARDQVNLLSCLLNETLQLIVEILDKQPPTHKDLVLDRLFSNLHSLNGYKIKLEKVQEC